ncbi:colorectal cancer associated 2 [Vanacampus margaritifer]
MHTEFVIQREKQSDKPRVYQGVRVKTTVKELLQRHRAREANRKKVKTISQACLDLQALCAPTIPSSYVEASTAPITDPGTCGSTAPQPSPSSFPDNGCSIQVQESSFTCSQQPFGDMMVPTDCYSGDDIINNSSSSSSSSRDGCYNSSVPPPSSFPLPWSHGLAFDSDNYSHGLAPCSSPESLKMCSTMDHNNYSPQDSFSSSSSSPCYNSPTRMECKFISYLSEYYHSQHCTLQDCYCLPQCWANPQENFGAPEYSPYYPPTDYAYPCLMEENYFKSNFAMSTEMCYNVL